MFTATWEVFVSEEKEVNGFGIAPDITEPEYDEFFATAAVDCRHLADISPVYFSNKHGAERIRRYSPEAKIIVTLRGPVSCVVSQCRHIKRKVDASLGPEIVQDINSYLRNVLPDSENECSNENSLYFGQMSIYHSKHIQRYYKSFPDSQILVPIYEDVTRSHPFGEGQASSNCSSLWA